MLKNFIGSTLSTSRHLGSIIIANIDLVPDWQHVEPAKALPSHKCAGSSLSSQQSAVAEEDLRMREAAGWAFPSPSWFPSCRHISSLTPHLAKSSLFAKVSMFIKEALSLSKLIEHRWNSCLNVSRVCHQLKAVYTWNSLWPILAMFLQRDSLWWKDWFS